MPKPPDTLPNWEYAKVYPVPGDDLDQLATTLERDGWEFLGPFYDKTEQGTERYGLLFGRVKPTPSSLD